MVKRKIIVSKQANATQALQEARKAFKIAVANGNHDTILMKEKELNAAYNEYISAMLDKNTLYI